MMDARVPGLYEQYFAVTDSQEDSSQHADIALTDQGECCLCWQTYENKHDTIYAARLEGERPSPRVAISAEGQALQPRIHFFRGKMWIVWSECVGRRWSLLMRSFQDGEAGEIIPISQSAGVFFPCVVSSADAMAIAWCEQEHGDSRVMLAFFDGENVSEKRQVSVNDRSYRPGLCYGEDGALYIAYDFFAGDHYDIGLRILQEGALGEEKVLSTEKHWAASPIMTRVPGGVLLVWYDIAAKSAMTYYSVQLAQERGRVTCGGVSVIARSTAWSNYLSLTSCGERVVLSHTIGNRMIVARVRQADGTWSEATPLVVNERYYTLGQRILLGSDGALHVTYESSNINGHHDRNAEVIYGRLRFEALKPHEDPEMGRYVSKFTRPIEGDKSLPRLAPETVRAWLDRNGYQDLMVKFGDIHGQCTMSDGSGEMDHYYNFARYGTPKMDFTALTDHESFADIITESEWEFMRTSSNEFNDDGKFVTLLAYEWTSNEFRYDFGHKNVYYPGSDGELFRVTDPEGLTPDRLFASLKKYGAICIPHHPAGVWGGYHSHSTDWDFHDGEVQRLAEIFSRHAPYEKYGDRSAFTKNQPGAKGHYVQDALKRGYRMGFIAGSDSHQLEHGVEGGILGAFLPELTRKGLFDALYSRFVYATTGAQILVSLRVNGARMGSEITVKPGQGVDISVSVLGTGEIQSVELVKNSGDVEHRTGDGCACDFTLRDPQVSGGDYYYIRVNQKDGHQAWSSPIWVDVV